MKPKSSNLKSTNYQYLNFEIMKCCLNFTRLNYQRLIIPLHHSNWIEIVYFKFHFYLFIYQHIPADYAQSFNTSCHRFIPISHHNKNHRHSYYWDRIMKTRDMLDFKISKLEYRPMILMVLGHISRNLPFLYFQIF